MKKFVLNVIAILLMIGCLDDKTNYDYRDINDFSVSPIKIITNWQNSYVLYPGEEVTIKPVVRLSMDTLAQNVSYQWLLDGKLVGEEKSFTYKAEKTGVRNLVLSVMDKDTKVAFSRGTSIEVKSPLESGWLLLTESASGSSELSMVLGRTYTEIYKDEDGYERERDTVIYSDVRFNLVPNLGSKPIKVVENFAWTSDDDEVKSELMVLQRSGAVEVSGVNLERLVETTSDFDATGAPSGFMAKNAVLTWGSKWLLNEKDNKIYGALATVTSDLHSGYYSSDPAFNGKQFRDILPCYKTGSNIDVYKIIVAIGMDNTMYGIIDNGTPTDHYSNDFSIYYDNYNGAFAELKAASGVEIDMSWFQNFDGDYIYHAFMEPDYYGNPYFSIVSKNGTYYWHQFSIEIPYGYVDGPLEIASSEVGSLNPQMFSDYVDAALLINNSEEGSTVLVASGNKIYAATYVNGESGTELKGDFPARIAGIAVKDSRWAEYNSHLGVVLEDGNFYVFEVMPAKRDAAMHLKELFHKNLKELNPNFGKVVELTVKYGDGSNVSFYRPF